MKHATFQVKASTVSTDKGTFTAVISTESIDRGGDVVIASAMVAALREWLKVDKKIPLAWAHSSEAKDIIGWVDPATVRAVGGEVIADGWVDQSTDVGVEAWRLVKSGAIGLSFGDLVLEDVVRPDGVHEIRRLDVSEVSLVATPANNDTRILGFKTAQAAEPYHRPQRLRPRPSQATEADLRKRAEAAGLNLPWTDRELRKASDAAVKEHVTVPSRALRRRSEEQQLAAAIGDTNLPPTEGQRRKRAERAEMGDLFAKEYGIMLRALLAEPV